MQTSERKRRLACVSASLYTVAGPHVRLHNQHALGLVVRLIGEPFAALPTIQLATVSALQPAANGKPTRYIASAHADRSTWSALHIRGAVTADAATDCLQEMGARCNMTAIGTLLAIGPFD